MSKAFKAWFKTQTFIPQGDSAYAEMAWDAAVEATKEKAAKVCEEKTLRERMEMSRFMKDETIRPCKCAAAIRSLK